MTPSIASLNGIATIKDQAWTNDTCCMIADIWYMYMSVNWELTDTNMNHKRSF